MNVMLKTNDNCILMIIHVNEVTSGNALVPNFMNRFVLLLFNLINDLISALGYIAV